MTANLKETPTKPWKLHIGIHRGTIISRGENTTSVDYDTYEPLNRFEQCLETAKKWRLNYESMGYVIHFCHAISPEGKKYPNILPSNPYRDR